MYLFGSGKRYINVYAFELKGKEAKKFKMSEMQRLSENTRVYDIREILQKGDIPIFTKDMNNRKQYYTEDETKGVTFIPCGKWKREDVLKDYYNGYFTNLRIPKNLVQVRESQNSDSHTKYYLVGHSPDKSRPAWRNTITFAFMVIRLPKSLYLLQALEQGSFHLVEGYPLDRQLDLFQVHHVDNIQAESLKCFDTYGITTNAQKNLEKKIIHDEPLIRMLKQEGRI